MTQLAAKTTAPQKMDARKVRSREALRAAFLELLEYRPLDQIAIREIAAAAGVGHATFYRHYPDKEALLDDLAADQIQRLVDLTLPVLDAVDIGAACLALCRHINAHRTLWSTLLTGGAAATVKAELLRISQEVAARSTLILNQDNGLPADLKVVVTVTSMLETLAWWLQQKRAVATGEVARYLELIITS